MELKEVSPKESDSGTGTQEIPAVPSPAVPVDLNAPWKNPPGGEDQNPATGAV